MSDPVTNSEVEDVLASVRRLVDGPKGTSAPRNDDRLVLTPQQRIGESSVLQLTPDQAIETADDVDAGQTTGLTASLTDEMAAIDAAVVERTEGPQSTPLILKPSDKAEPAVDGHDSSASEEAGHPKPLDKKYSGLSEKIAALETAIARTEDQWEPDGEGRDAYAGTTPPAMTWPANVDLDGLGKPVEPTSSDRPLVASDDDSAVLDEDTLREIIVSIVRQELDSGMVAQAVREELQGDLGARITSNIRKLVRREINLALTAQGLD